MAARAGVHLEVSARHSHGLANGRVVACARQTGAALVLDSDAHAPGDLLCPEWREKVAFGAGLTQKELERIDGDMAALVERLVPSSNFA
jgi:histidinol phosphatase-like PHP family hydrolase